MTFLQLCLGRSDRSVGNTAQLVQQEQVKGQQLDQDYYCKTVLFIQETKIFCSFVSCVIIIEFLFTHAHNIFCVCQVRAHGPQRN